MSIKRRKFLEGIRLKGSANATTLEGELRLDPSALTFKAYVDGAERSIVTEDQAQTLTNKTVDADNNTVSNLETDNLKAGVLNTDLSGAATDTEIPSALAVKNALAGQNEASEITYDPSSNPETANTNVQDALDDTGIASQAAQDAADAAQTTADDHIADAADAHAASAITNTPSGNLAATDVQGAVNELQSDIDTRALDSDLTDHINDATDAHAASAITNTPSGNLAATDIQGAVDELQSDIDTRALDADLTSHTGASSGVHGVTGNVVGDTDTQTLTNKTITGASIQTPSRLDVKQDTQANLETYAASASNGQLCFATDTKLMYQVVDSALVSVGTGGGLKNYIENGKAEVDASGWTVYANTSAGALPDDFGGTPSGNLTFTRNTTSPLSGDADFKLSTTAANLQGEGAYYEFTLDKVDLATVLSFIVRKDASDSGIADGDYRYVLVSSSDSFVADFNIIRSVSEDLNGATNDNIANFQTDASDLAYRLCIHRTTTDATATDLYLDELEFGPRNLSNGSGLGNIVVEGAGNGGTSIIAATTNLDFTETRDTTSSWDGTTFTAPESGEYSFYGATAYTTAVSRYVRPIIDGSHDGTFYGGFASSATSAFSFKKYLSKGQTLSLQNSVGGTLDDDPKHNIHIQKVGTSDEANATSGSGREIFVHGSGNLGTAITADTENIDFTLVEQTEGGLWTQTGPNGPDTFNALESGYYQIVGSVGVTTSNTSYVKYFIDGVEQQERNRFFGNTVAHLGQYFYLEKGQTLNIRLSTTYTLLTSGVNHWIKIIKNGSGGSSQDLIPTVAARYTSDSGQTVTSGSAIDFEDLDYDTHGAYVSGVYTIPLTGKYLVKAQTRFSTAVSGSIGIEVNGVEVVVTTQPLGSNGDISMLVTEVLDLVKGDTVEIVNAGGSNKTYSSNTEDNNFSIARIK